MAHLREAMARFSHGEDHTRRRQDVELAISRIDSAVLAAAAIGHAERHALAAPNSGITSWEMASRIGVEALVTAMALDVPESQLWAVVDKVELVVRAIGRGEETGPAGDRACEELLAMFDEQPIDAVAGVSVLYQVFDAIVALAKSVFAAEQTGAGRASALAGTVRVAVVDAEIAGRPIAAGDQLNLAFTTAAEEFGAGPHRCPGADLAWVLVDALRGSSLKFG